GFEPKSLGSISILRWRSQPGHVFCARLITRLAPSSIRVAKNFVTVRAVGFELFKYVFHCLVVRLGRFRELRAFGSQFSHFLGPLVPLFLGLRAFVFGWCECLARLSNDSGAQKERNHCLVFCGRKGGTLVYERLQVPFQA